MDGAAPTRSNRRRQAGATTDRWPAWLALILLAVAASGCRSLPRDMEPGAPSYALDPPRAGPVAELAGDCAERYRDQSCFLLLDRNQDDLYWRLALIDSAKVSIDIQTYLWRRDFSGRLLFSRVLDAAERGVRVRLLVDDFLTRGVDRVIATLDHHPNVEIRLWNPGRQRRVGRNLDFLVRLRELNHRLHNKVLVVDNLAVIAGGRNIADAYFGLSDSYNFFDLDLLGVGPLLPPVSGMFDYYWNSPQAVPGATFYGRATDADIPAVKETLRRSLADSPLSHIVPIAPRAWDERFAAGRAAMVPGTADVIYDKPGEREPSQDALIGLQRFIRQAQTEVLAANAYLVPGEPFFEEGRELEARGVHMAIITNSLGSTNQTIVHHAYSRARRPLLEAGVDVFEMKYQGGMQRALDTPPVESEWVGLHAKAAVIDRKRTFIGSFNFSPRSRNLNLELGILVDSPEFGVQVGAVMDRVMAPDNAWRLALDAEGRLSWISEDGTLTRQPAQGFWRRVQNGIFGLFPLEQHL